MHLEGASDRWQMPNDANQNVRSTALVNSVSYPVGVVGRPGLDPGTLGSDDWDI